MASDERAIARTSRTLMNHLKRMGDQSAGLPEIANAFLKKFGGGDVTDGYRRLGECLAEDLDTARGVGIGDPGENWVKSDFVIQKYYALAIDIIKKNDDNRQIDVSSLTDEDLSASLSSVAIQQAQADPEYRKILINQLLASDPDARKEIMEMGGASVIDEAEKEPIALIEEDLVYDEDQGHLDDDE